MLLGIITASWGGAQIPLKTGNTFDLGGVVSNPVVVGTNVDFANSMQASEIALKVAVEKGVNISSTYPAGVAQELQINCDTGQSFVWASAFRKGTIKITSGDNSEADVTFAGGTPLEIS